MTYESGRNIGELPKDLHRLGKALARGSDFKAIADAAMNCPGLKKAIEDCICSQVNDECKRLCSKKDASLLRSATKDSIFNFSWETVGIELAEQSTSPSSPALSFGGSKITFPKQGYRKIPWCLCSNGDIAENPRQRNELGVVRYQHDSQGWKNF